MSVDDDADRATWREDIREHRRHLVEALHTASQDFDKAVMTLAAGALGISLAFVHDFAPDPRHTLVLGVAWLLFAFSLVFVLVSFIASQEALRWEIRHVADDEPRGDRPHPKRVTRLNIAAAATFIVGVVALVGFALLNLGRTTTHG